MKTSNCNGGNKTSVVVWRWGCGFCFAWWIVHEIPITIWISRVGTDQLLRAQRLKIARAQGIPKNAPSVSVCFSVSGSFSFCLCLSVLSVFYVSTCCPSCLFILFSLSFVIVSLCPLWFRVLSSSCLLSGLNCLPDRCEVQLYVVRLVRHHLRGCGCGCQCLSLCESISRCSRTRTYVSMSTCSACVCVNIFDCIFI